MSGGQLDVLAIAHSCVMAINRVIYRELSAAGWNLELVVPETWSGEKGHVRKADPRQPDDPPLHPLPLHGPNQRLYRYDGLWALLEARRPRIVLIDADPGSLVALEAGVWAKRRGAQVICQSCENMDRDLGQRLRQRLYKRAAADVVIEGLTAASRAVVDHVFVLSNDGVDVLSKQGFRGRVSKIPLGFDGRIFRPDEEARVSARKQLGLSGFTIAYFGRQVPTKGVHLLVEALAGMLDRPWQFLLDRFAEFKDPYAQRLADQIAASGMTERTVFFDAKHEEMPRYMNAADLVVLPSVSSESWREQYGRVAPEAMACGRVVLASSCGALPELVGDAGLIFPEGDVGAMRKQILRVLDDAPLRADLAARATARAHGSLSVTSQRDIMGVELRRHASPSNAT